MKRLIVLALLLCSFPALAQAAAPGYTKINTSAITATSYTDAGCPNLSSCYYQITAIDAQGFESQPGTCSATQLCIGGNQMYVQMPSSGIHAVALSWTASATSGVTYNVYRHIGPLPTTNGTATVN